jgi:hypothetical protein
VLLVQKSSIEPEARTQREVRVVVVAHATAVARVNAVDLAIVIVIVKAVAKNVAAIRNEAEAVPSPESSSLQRWVSELLLSPLPSDMPPKRTKKRRMKTIVAVPGIEDIPLALTQKKWMTLGTPNTETRRWHKRVPLELPWLPLLIEPGAGLVVAETDLAPRAGFVKGFQSLPRAWARLPLQDYMRGTRLRRRRGKPRKKTRPLGDDTDQGTGLSLGRMMKFPVKARAVQRCFPVLSMAKSR